MSPPTILILGGLAGDSTRLLLAHLFPLNESGEMASTFVRIVDKYLLMPGNDVYNIYIDDEARRALKRGLGNGKLDYSQGNLMSDRRPSSLQIDCDGV